MQNNKSNCTLVEVMQIQSANNTNDAEVSEYNAIYRTYTIRRMYNEMVQSRAEIRYVSRTFRFQCFQHSASDSNRVSFDDVLITAVG